MGARHLSLSLTHSVVEDGLRRICLHSFVRMSEDLVVRSVSEPFVFEHQGIEFAAGLAVDVGLDRAWIGYGFHDSRAMLASFELSRLLTADIWKEGLWDDAS